MPIVTGNAGGDDAPGRSRRPIQLGPGLLVYLDALKRRQFLDAWRSSVEPAGRWCPACPYNGGMSEYTILIADDHPLLRSAVVQSLRQSLPLAQVREVASAEALAEALDAYPDVDLVLLDLTMPGAHGFSALLHARLASGHPGGDPLVQRPPTGDPPCPAVRRGRLHSEVGPGRDHRRGRAGAVLDGGLWFPAMAAERSEADALLASRLAQLTPQQFRVLLCLADGLLNKQIAYTLGLAENTVKVHVTAILKKLECHSRTQAAVLVKALEPEGDAGIGL